MTLDVDTRDDEAIEQLLAQLRGQRLLDSTQVETDRSAYDTQDPEVDG